MRLTSVMLLLIVCCVARPVAAQDGVNDYIAGLDALAAGKFKDAEKSFTKAIDADEENADYWIARGVARALGENPQKSEDDFKRALKLQPNVEEARLWWASAVAMQGDFMRDSTIYPYAQFQKTYENTVRSVTKDYGQANWELAKAKSEGEEYWDTKKSKADQKVAVAKFPDLAKRFVAKVKTNNPSIAKALEGRVKQKLENADPAGSLDDLNRLLAARPDDPKLLAMHAQAALSQGAAGVAREEYTRILTISDDPDAFFGRARAAAMMGDADRAHRDLEVASSLNASAAGKYKEQVEKDLNSATTSAKKEDLPTLLAQLQEHAQAGKWNDLVAEAEAFVRASNRYRLRSDERYADRLREFKRAAMTIPTSADACADLGEFLFREADMIRGEIVEPRATLHTFRPQTKDSQREEMAAAERAVDQALAIKPGHFKAMTFKAACLIWRLQWGDAETMLKKALSMKSDDPMVLRLFARVMDHAASVRAAKASNLRAVDSWSDLSYIYWRYPSQAELDAAEELDAQAERLWKIAVAAFESAAAARKGTPEGFYYQGVLDRRRGNPQAAIAAFQECLKGAPQNIEARDELISVLYQMRQIDQALQEQATNDNLVQTTCAPLLRLTWLMIPQTKFKSARQALDRAQSLDPADARVAAYRGTLAQEKDDAEGAIGWYRAAAAILEANARMNGCSAARPAIRPALEPEDVGLTTAVNVRTAQLLLAQDRAADALELFRATTLVEPRVNRDNLYNPLPVAMIPSAEMDPNRIPEADHLAYFLAWAHYGAAKALMSMNKPDEVLKEANVARAYELEKPPTVDCGSHIREVTTRATILMARAALATGDVETARNTALAYGRPWGLPKDVEQELRQLQDDLRKQNGQDRDGEDSPPPPPRRRGRGR